MSRWNKVKNMSLAMNSIKKKWTPEEKKEIRDEIRKIHDQLDRKKEDKNEHLDKRHMIYYIIRALIVKLAILAFSCYIIYFMQCLTSDYGNIGLIVVLLVIVADIIYVCVWRKGRDFTW